MKKALASLLALTLVFSLAACGSSDSSTEAEDTTVAAEEAEEAEEEEAEEEEAEEAEDEEAGEEAAAAASGDLMTIDEAIDTVVSELSLNEEDFADLDPVSITVASSAASANFNYDIMEALMAAITEQTGGKMTFSDVWDGTLGSDNELTESVEAGDIEIVFEGTSSLANYIPEAAVFDMPGLFSDCDEGTAACRAFLDDFNDVCANYNLVALDVTVPMFRALSTNKEITSPDDLSGISIRCAENKYYQAFYSNLGMSPTPLAFSELYMSLQQGLVDAQDNPISVMYSSKFYEVQSYYMEINAIAYPFALLMNRNIYENLDPAYQDALTQLAVLFFDGNIMGQPYADQESLDEVSDQMTVLEMTDEIQEAVVAAGEPVWDMVAEDIGEDVVDTFLACAGK